MVTFINLLSQWAIPIFLIVIPTIGLSKNTSL